MNIQLNLITVSRIRYYSTHIIIHTPSEQNEEVEKKKLKLNFHS